MRSRNSHDTGGITVRSLTICAVLSGRTGQYKDMLDEMVFWLVRALNGKTKAMDISELSDVPSLAGDIVWLLIRHTF